MWGYLTGTGRHWCECCEDSSLVLAATDVNVMWGFLTGTNRHWCECYVRLPHWHWPPLVRMLCGATSLALAATVRMLCDVTSLALAATGANVMWGFLTGTSRHWCEYYVRLHHWHWPPLLRMLCEATSLALAATGANVMWGYLTAISRHLNECTFGESSPLALVATEANMSLTVAFLTTTNQI